VDVENSSQTGPRGLPSAGAGGPWRAELTAPRLFSRLAGVRASTGLPGPFSKPDLRLSTPESGI